MAKCAEQANLSNVEMKSDLSTTALERISTPILVSNPLSPIVKRLLATVMMVSVTKVTIGESSAMTTPNLA
jgi:hypothetical protein